MSSDIHDIDIIKTWCLSGMLNFTRYFFKKRYNRKFIVGKHHELISNALDKVISGEIKKLMINIAPRYGKTELAVKNFIAQGLAINPAAKFIHLSYSDDLVRDNSADVQAIMNTPEYRRLFDAAPLSNSSKKWYTKEGGGLYAVSSAGQVTGFGAGLVDDAGDENEEEMLDEFMPYVDNSSFGGAIIIDDPIKPDDALSDTQRNKVNNKFDTTIRNRVNSRNTPLVIIMQRLHQHDLCGYLLETEPEKWTVLSLPCIYTDEKGNEKALWEFKHTLEELRELERINSYVFETQYMQNPKPLEGLMYQEFRTYDTLPTGSYRIKNYTDTADTGADYLCSITYAEFDTALYVLDVLYTKKPMEYTEPETARMLTRNAVVSCIVESNNGGRGFRRNVERCCRELGNNQTRFQDYTQTLNKQVRIFSHSAEVNNLVFFPTGWNHRWREFYDAITSYQKEGGNAHDDAPDALTGLVEHRDSRQTSRFSRT